MDDCKHGMNPAWCGLCTGRTGEVATLDDAVVIDTFTAQYAGRCDRCSGPIRTDDRIGRLNDDQGYVCTRCLP